MKVKSGMKFLRKVLLILSNGYYRNNKLKIFFISHAYANAHTHPVSKSHG